MSAMHGLDFSSEPPLRLREDPISFDGEIQYGGRTPKEELEHLERGEAEAYAEVLTEHGLPLSTKDYPWATPVEEAAHVLAQIKANTIKLWDGLNGGRIIPAVSKGFQGTSKLHVASLPGSDGIVYDNVVLCCLEEKLSFGVVWEGSWKNLWFWVWKLRQVEAHRLGKHFLVLTKDDGSVGFNQSIEVMYLRREGIPFQHMTARSLLRQLRPMIQAAWYEDYDTVRELLQKPEAEELLQHTMFNGYTTLAVLARNGQTELAHLALAAGADLETANFGGGTALFIAVDKGQLEVVSLLLQARADATTAEHVLGFTPLIKAAWHGHASAVQLLLAARVDPDQAAENGSTPLFNAAQQDQREAATALLAARAEVDRPNNEGTTPLIMASQRGDLALVGLLLAARADPNQAEDGNTLLSYAANQGQRELAAALLAARAEVDCPSNKGITPLIMASHWGHLALVGLLLEARADTAPRDSSGNTAFEAAKGHTEVQALLTRRLTGQSQS